MVGRRGRDLGLKPPGYMPASLRDYENQGRFATTKTEIVTRSMTLPGSRAGVLFSPFSRMKGLRC